MGDHHHQPHYSLPVDLNVRDPEFPRKAVLQVFQIRCELEETIIAAKRTIATSKRLLAEADRLLALR